MRAATANGPLRGRATHPGHDDMTHEEAVRLNRDARKALEGVERIIGELAHAGGEQAEAAGKELRRSARLARDRLVDIEESAVLRARRTGRHARTWAHHHPWTTGGIALAAVLVVAAGLLARRRQD
jgi:ElaB/YqjD/DUF883 family membrane-anchored ribosome-binding protein